MRRIARQIQRTHRRGKRAAVVHAPSGKQRIKLFGVQIGADTFGQQRLLRVKRFIRGSLKTRHGGENFEAQIARVMGIVGADFRGGFFQTGLGDLEDGSVTGVIGCFMLFLFCT